MNSFSNTLFFQNSTVKEFELGAIYLIGGKMYRFIKVTPKGFNFLSLDTHRCKLKHHLYDRRWVGKCIPNNVFHFKCRILQWVSPVKVKTEKRA